MKKKKYIYIYIWYEFPHASIGEFYDMSFNICLKAY